MMITITNCFKHSINKFERIYDRVYHANFMTDESIENIVSEIINNCLFCDRTKIVYENENLYYSFSRQCTVCYIYSKYNNSCYYIFEDFGFDEMESTRDNLLVFLKNILAELYRLQKEYKIAKA